MNASHVGDWDYSPGGGGGGDEGFAGSTTKNMKTIRYKKDDYCHKEYVFVSGFETYRNLGDTFVGIPSAFESDEVDENEYFTDPQCPDIMTQLKIKTSKSKLESLTYVSLHCSLRVHLKFILCASNWMNCTETREEVFIRKNGGARNSRDCWMLRI